MQLLIQDLGSPKPPTELQAKLATKGVVRISQGDWERINAAEVAAGEPHSKPRIKFVKREEMLGIK
jgi:ferredoxin--NADP+ reductase